MMRPTGRMLVQYGCGLSTPAEWLNFDCSPTLRLQRIPLAGAFFRQAIRPRFPDAVRYGDIVKGLPIPPRSADCVYCSHVLEHLSLADLRVALHNTRKYLVPNGVFRLVLPDLRRLATEYVATPTAEAAHRFMRDADLGCENRERGLIGFLRLAVGNARHLWMWDYESLSTELKAAGFHDIRRAYFHDSGEPAFQAVESESRWADNLGIECRA